MAKTITVKGVGTASSKPDFVTVSINLKGEDKDYVAAVEKANSKIIMLQKALLGAGFDKDDLKTLNFSANTKYEYEHGKQTFNGYSSVYHLKLGFDFTAERLAKTLTAIANSGADAEFSIAFTVKNPEKISEQLLISATENARQKAEVLAKASGKTLGELVSIDYNWNEIEVYSHSQYALAAPRGMAMEAAVPEFTPDDIQSNDTVTFVWEIV